MAEREDNVYKAKLAEQAERYDGKFTPYLSDLRIKKCDHRFTLPLLTYLVPFTLLGFLIY